MNLNRWNLAQNYEKNWWGNNKNQISNDFYQESANELIESISGNIVITKNSTILEIGSGAIGIISFIDSDHKYGVDPLEHYYSTVDSFVKSRDPRVKYSTAMGEELPFEANFFDLIIIDNVLDHCSFPEKVMSELDRVLKAGGLVYFRQNTYHFWGVFVRRVMEKVMIDKGHPFTFSKRALKDLFFNHNLNIISFNSNGYFKTWKREFFSLKLKEIAKALLFATRDKALYILKKN